MTKISGTHSQLSYVYEDPLQLECASGLPERNMAGECTVKMNFPAGQFRDPAHSDDPETDSNKMFQGMCVSVITPLLSTMHYLLATGNLEQLEHIANTMTDIARGTFNNDPMVIVALPVAANNFDPHSLPETLSQEELQDMAEQGVAMLLTASTLMHQKYGTGPDLSMYTGLKKSDLSIQCIPCPACANPNDDGQFKQTGPDCN